MKKELKSFLTDSMWSIAGLVLMNVAAQFVVYPAWNRRLGSESYGNILYLMSLLNIVAISMGSGTNYARMTCASNEKCSNNAYLLLLGIVSLLAFPFSAMIQFLGGVPMSGLDCLLFALLLCATMWRFYADVEYRLSLNYKGYFLYYLSISIGYLVGIFLMNATGLWPLALLPGELLGIIIVAFKGNTLRWDSLLTRKEFQHACRVILILFVTNVMSNIVFNGDRLLLKFLLGGSSVTVYYLASLLGKTLSLITTPLNSVIMSYLARYKGSPSTKQIHLVSLASVLLSVLSTGVCTVASHILIPILYPQDFAASQPYFILGNSAQVLFFVGNVISVILIRFADTKYQIHINVVYAISFCVLCIPFTWKLGLIGFCFSLFLTCLLRLAYSLHLCYRHIGKKEV